MAALFELYHKMYENPLLFKLNCLLLRTGVEKEIAYYFKTLIKEKKAVVNKDSKEFFERNKESLLLNEQLLADEKSREIYRAVINYRIQKSPLKRDLYSLDDQYFVRDILNVENQEVFVDCGAFVGDTINNLIIEARKNHKSIRKVVAFEPEHNNYLLLKKYYANNSNIIPVEAGVSDCNKEMRIVGASTYARITDVGSNDGIRVSLKSIDNMPECHDATFIKMDIEGAELDALKGAEKTIRRNKPKLAICIYHSNEDMIRIIPFVYELNPAYKLYIRHHSRDASETVLYAIP